jgi:uncharacterized membrane protein
MALSSKRTCALTLSFIALTDIFIILDIPILRQVFGFALLTFLPGYLIIQILLFGRTSLEKMLFLVGLSVSFLLFVPLLMNFVYPSLGISRPISLSPLVATFSVILAGLSLAAYEKGLNLQINTGGLKKLTGKIMAPPVVGAALIVIFGILGGLSVRFYLDSIFSLLLGLSIAIIVVLIITDRVSQRFYPLYILVIAIALQYTFTLASPNLFGTDGMYELYFANLVKLSGVWYPSFAVTSDISDYYAMLSVAILPNVYSILLNLDTIWVFKLICPIIFAFVPLGLYELFRTQIRFGDKLAFLAVFLFVSFFAFVQLMPTLTKQEIAELFFVLVVLLIMNRYPQASIKAALLIVFISSMAVSHYSTSYIFLSYLGVFCLGSALLTSRTRQKSAVPAVSVTIAVLAVVILFGWYIFAGAGTPFGGLLSVGTHALNSLSSDVFSTNSDPYVVAGLGGRTVGLSLIHALGRYWQIVTEVLIMVGLASVIWQRKTSKMTLQFLVFSLASLFLLLLVVALPALGGAINSWRSYSFALFFLAPCCMLGVEFVVEAISGWLGANRRRVIQLTSAALIVLIVPYFLFSYGFIYEIAEHPANYAFLPTQNLNGRGVEYSDNATWSYLISGPVPAESIYASTWLSGSIGQSSVYADWIRAPELAAYGNISPDSVTRFSNWTAQHILSNSYIYFGPANVQRQSIAIQVNRTNEELKISSVPEVAAASRVYDSGLVEVYRTH